MTATRQSRKEQRRIEREERLVTLLIENLLGVSVPNRQDGFPASARSHRLAWWHSLTFAQQQEYGAQKDAERVLRALDEEFRVIVS